VTAVLVIAAVCLAVWLVDWLTKEHARSERRRRGNNVRHIEKPWWKEPPDDGPEGDY